MDRRQLTLNRLPTMRLGLPGRPRDSTPPGRPSIQDDGMRSHDPAISHHESARLEAVAVSAERRVLSL